MTLGIRRGLSIGLLTFGLLSARAAHAQDAALDAVADGTDAADATDATTDIPDALDATAVDGPGDATASDATASDATASDAKPADAVTTDGPPKDGGASDGAVTDAATERPPYRNFENETGCCSIGGDGRSGYASLLGAGTLLALAFLRRRR